MATVKRPYLSLKADQLRRKVPQDRDGVLAELTHRHTRAAAKVRTWILNHPISWNSEGPDVEAA